MSKVGDYDDHGVPQNQRDFNDDVRRVINFGKYQQAVLSSPPGFIGRLGEQVTVISGTTGRIYICTTDNKATWALGFTFTL